MSLVVSLSIIGNRKDREPQVLGLFLLWNKIFKTNVAVVGLIA
jgi:hypothetical protein